MMMEHVCIASRWCSPRGGVSVVVFGIPFFGLEGLDGDGAVGGKGLFWRLLIVYIFFLVPGQNTKAIAHDH